MGNNQRTTLVGLAAMILGIMAAARSTSIDAAQAVIAGGQAAMIQGQLNFSRDMEREADRVGYGVLVGGGFAGSGMVAMFDRLGQASRLNDSGGFPYLRSHPLTTERVGDARARLGVADGVTAAPLAQPWLHALMQGRARALMDPRDETLRRLARGAEAATDLPDTPETFTNTVAGVLAAVQLRQWPLVDAGLVRLGRLAPPDAAVQRALRHVRIEVALARDQAGMARHLMGPLPDTPLARPDLLLSTRIELAGAGPRAGLARHAERLQTWVALQPEDATAWALLSQLQERLGQPLSAMRAMAESRRALGDLDGAVDRLRAGQRMVGEVSGGRDSIEASVISTRLKDLELERRRAREQEQEFR
jgi:predicted Zn-dependent protease